MDSELYFFNTEALSDDGSSVEQWDDILTFIEKIGLALF